VNAKELVMYIAAFTGPLTGNSVLALLGTLRDEWSVSSGEILLSISAFMFPFAIGQLFSGAISDAYDRRGTMSTGLFVYAIGIFIAAASPSFSVFMVSRVVQGVGNAFVVPVIVPVLSDVAGPGRQGVSMGYFGSFTSAGVAAGPFIAGLFVDINWRLTFVVIGILSLVVLALILILFEKDPNRGHATIRAIGSKLASAFKTRSILGLSAAGFLTFMAQIGVISFVSDYMSSDVMGLTGFDVGLALGLSAALGIVVSPLAGKVVDRRGVRASIMVGFILASTSAFVMQFSGGYVEFIGLLCVSAIGSSFIWAPLLVHIVRSRPDLKGTASSVFSFSRFLGYALSPIMLIPVFDSGGFAAVMVVCSMLLVAAMMFAVTAGARRPSK